MKRILGYLLASIGIGALWYLLAYGLLSVVSLPVDVVKVASTITGGAHIV